MLAPNKQNLLLLRNQKKMVTNGHKLLKEKRAGLILNFLELAKKGKQLENLISKQLTLILNQFRSSLMFTSTYSLLKQLTAEPSTHLQINKKRISGVYVDSLSIAVKPPKRFSLKPIINRSLEGFGQFFPILLELSQLKLNCEKIANEIKKTNRQILNLERRIEEIDSEIKFIEMTLNEMANLEKATQIKIFK